MRKFEFNELTLNMIHQLYQNDNHFINHLFKEGVLIKFIKLHFNNKPIFINSTFNWKISIRLQYRFVILQILFLFGELNISGNRFIFHQITFC